MLASAVNPGLSERDARTSRYIAFRRGKLSKKELAAQRQQYKHSAVTFVTFHQPSLTACRQLPSPPLDRAIVIHDTGEGSDEVVWSIDIGERQFGLFAGAIDASNLESTLEFLLWDNMNMFPRVMPTFDSLCRYFGLKPLGRGESRRRATRALDAVTKSIYESRLIAFEEAEERMKGAIKECAKYRKKNPHVPESPLVLEDDPDAQFLHDLKQQGCNIDTRRRHFVMSPFFGQPARRGEDDDAPIPNNVQDLVSGFCRILPIYYDFLVRTVGKPTRVVIESQPITITTTGAIVEAVCAAFFRLQGIEHVDHIKASKKLKVFYLEEPQISRMISGNLWLPKYWSRFGKSGTIAYMHEKITNEKLATFAPELIHHAEVRASLGLEPLEYEHSRGRKRKNKDVDHEDDDEEERQDAKKSKSETGIPTHSPIAVDDDDDGEVVVLRPKQAIHGQATMPPAVTKKVAAVAAKTKIKTAAAATSKRAFFAAKASGRNPFANRSNKRTSDMRLENKDEAVARVTRMLTDLSFEEGDFAGYEWYLRFKHMWDHSKRKDGSDALLQAIAYMFRHTKKKRCQE